MAHGMRHARVDAFVDPPPQHDRERAPERWCGLHGREGRLPDVHGAVEAEDSVDLVHGHGLPDANDVGVHPPDVLQIGEEEGTVVIEVARDDVLGVLDRERGEVVEVVARPVVVVAAAVPPVARRRRPPLPAVGSVVLPLEQKLLVVRHLDDEGTAERFLQPRSEEEGH